MLIAALVLFVSAVYTWVLVTSLADDFGVFASVLWPLWVPPVLLFLAVTVAWGVVADWWAAHVWWSEPSYFLQPWSSEQAARWEAFVAEQYRLYPSYYVPWPAAPYHRWRPYMTDKHPWYTALTALRHALRFAFFDAPSGSSLERRLSDLRALDRALGNDLDQVAPAAARGLAVAVLKEVEGRLTNNACCRLHCAAATLIAAVDRHCERAAEPVNAEASRPPGCFEIHGFFSTNGDGRSLEVAPTIVRNASSAARFCAIVEDLGGGRGRLLLSLSPPTDGGAYWGGTLVEIADNLGCVPVRKVPSRPKTVDDLFGGPRLNLDPPGQLLANAYEIGAWFEARGVRDWALGPVRARVYGTVHDLEEGEVKRKLNEVRTQRDELRQQRDAALHDASVARIQAGSFEASLRSLQQRLRELLP